MGFFQKLKKRLFTLDGDSKKEKAIAQPKAPNLNVQSANQAPNALKIKRRKSTLNKYIAGINKSGASFTRRMQELQTKHNKVDEAFLEDLEELLIMADISVKLVVDIIDEIRKEVQIENVQDPELISEIIADKMFAVYANQSTVDTTLNIQPNRLNIILMVGVNGAGKTTTIAKIAKQYLDHGLKVLLAAGDTFRAGAVAQLGVWAERIGADLVASQVQNADPGAVVFEALTKADQEQYDLLIIDTAGRLQNKVNLMQELAKINRIIQKKHPAAPHEALLVLDATTGQNGVSQAKHFQDVTNLSGIVLTKMDGTSKGGIVLTIKDELALPVKLIGLGEKLDDLQEFDLDAFIYGLTKGLIKADNKKNVL